jgi:hypothetical protein
MSTKTYTREELNRLSKKAVFEIAKSLGLAGNRGGLFSSNTKYGMIDRIVYSAEAKRRWKALLAEFGKP